MDVATEFEGPPRQLTVDEAVALAIVLQQTQLAGAEALYQRVLEADPDHPRALHYAGVLAHQQGRSEDGLLLIKRSLALRPDEADWHSNLGIVLQSSGRLDEAIDAYRRAIALGAGHANAHNNLGVLLRATGRPAEAEAAYGAAIALNPDHIDAYTNLGILLGGLGRSEEAAACYCKVITLSPKHRDARKLLALAHCALGEIDEATRIFEDWLAEEPGDPVATHMLAACSGRMMPRRASDAYIERTFDSFAASFESKLEKLSYRAPALVAAAVDAAGLEPRNHLVVLDAGCGTGLCGPHLSPFARRLVGVDLSQGMLDQAAAKQVYDQLVKSELTAYLRDHRAAFDLIVSADALVYFGDLGLVFDAAAGALRPNGVFVFTLEHAAAAASEPGYRLEYHGRYSHSRAYVEEILACLGLQVAVVPAELRMEAGTPVAGLVIRASKPAHASTGKEGKAPRT